MAKFLIQGRHIEDFVHDLGKAPVVMVGREHDNALILQDPHVSRKHFYIENRNGQFLLVNLSQTHGTVVNGKRVSRIVLREGDVVEAGGARLTFDLGKVRKPRGNRPDVAQPAESPDDGQPLASTPVGEGDEVTEAPGEIEPHTRTSEPSSSPVSLADLNKTVLIQPDSGRNTPSALAISDPVKATMEAMFESAVSQPTVDELRRRFLLLQDIGRQMVAELRLDSLLEFILAKIFEMLPADNGLVLLRDEKTDALEPKAVRLKAARLTGDSRLHISQTLIKEVCDKRVGILSANTLDDDILHAQKSIVALGIRSVMCVPLLLQDKVLGIIHVDSETSRVSFTQQDLDLLTLLANQAALSVNSASLHDQIVREETQRAKLERYFSPAIAKKIATNKIQLDSGVRSVEATVLYSDIRDFTPLSERVEPGDLVRFLNSYFSEMADIVFDHNGTLDKFLGDALVAVFGSPIAGPNDALNAARCAVAMIRRVREMTFLVGKISIGIGLHHGNVIHGNIGSEKMMQYTVIGDTVNTTERLSSVAERNQIVLSPTLAKTLGSHIETRPLGIVDLKGKSEPMETFELLRCLPETMQPD
jgi:adenylate cyclase